MPSEIKRILWLMKRAGNLAKDKIEYWLENPGETLDEIWEWIKRNKWTILVVAGVLVIVIPLAVGFGPAGVAAGSLAAAWQSGIGAVAAGSTFAILQSLAMTGVFMGIGGGLIGLGGLGGLRNMIGGLKLPNPPALPFSPGFVRRSSGGVTGGRGSSVVPGATCTTPPSGPVGVPEPPFSDAITPEGAEVMLLRWLAGDSGPPFDPEDAAITSEDARTIVLRCLVSDHELPSLLKCSSITQEERNKIWEAMALLDTGTLRDNGFLVP